MTQAGPQRVTSAEKDRIRELYEAGESASGIARALGRDRSVVRYWMDSMGLDKSAVTARWRETERHAVELKRNGETNEDIARALEVHTSTVRGMLARHGLTAPPPPAPISLDEANRLLRLYEAGEYNFRQLCAHAGRGHRAVRTALKRARDTRKRGPKPKPRRDPNAISEREREDIRSAYLAGTPMRELPAKFGRSETSIYRVTKGIKRKHRVERTRVVRLWKAGHSIQGIARYDKIDPITVRRKLAEAGLASTRPIADGVALVEAGVSVEDAAERVVCDPSQLRGALRRAARPRQAEEARVLLSQGLASADIATRLGPRWTRADVEKLLREPTVEDPG